MPHYCIITEMEMDSLFRPDKGWKKDYSSKAELIYVKNVGNRYQLKVYSSLSKSCGLSAKCGQDAIRVCGVNTYTDRGVIKTRRINRVPNWEGRLKDRVLEVWEQLMGWSQP